MSSPLPPPSTTNSEAAVIFLFNISVVAAAPPKSHGRGCGSGGRGLRGREVVEDVRGSGRHACFSLLYVCKVLYNIYADFFSPLKYRLQQHLFPVSRLHKSLWFVFEKKNIILTSLFCHSLISTHECAHKYSRVFFLQTIQPAVCMYSFHQACFPSRTDDVAAYEKFQRCRGEREVSEPGECRLLLQSLLPYV